MFAFTLKGDKKMVQVERVLVTGIQKVDFTTDEGKKMLGLKVFYLSPKSSTNPNEVGHIPGSRWVDASNNSYNHILMNGEGFYDMSLDLVLTGNKPKINFLGMNFIEKFDIFRTSEKKAS